MESGEDLHQAVQLYESQLEQVRRALSESGRGLGEEERRELAALEHSILELLHLTRQSLPPPTAPPPPPPPPPPPAHHDPLAAEYAAFKAELEELGEGGEEEEEEEASPPPPQPTVCLVDIQEELEELSGCKCEAPYTDRLGVTHYYNALVLSCSLDTDAHPSRDDSLHSVQVKVMFVNPTERDMVPCPYYLDGRCRFSDSDCNYSHGYLVPLSSLKEYREPEFESVRSGSAVLAKVPESEVWVSTRVEEVVSAEEVSVRHRGSTLSLPLHHVLPLAASAGSDGEDDLVGDRYLERSDDRMLPTGRASEEAVERSLTAVTVGSRRLGEWERHTKGIGSKLMAKMGYVVGAGLGRRGEGIIHPVQASVLPPGKSLDHCMRLREESGGDRDLFSVEKLQRRLKLKAERRSAAQYERSKRAERHDVFTLVNSITARPQHQTAPEAEGQEAEKSDRGLRKELESSSERRLNVELLKTEEAQERTRREVLGLQRRLAVKKEGSVEYNRISAELSRASDTLQRLSHTASRLDREIRIRRTKKKMAF